MVFFSLQKVELKLDLHEDKAKRKAMKTVSKLAGLESISMDMKERKLTVIGDVDPVVVVSKLRKLWHAEILRVEPAKDEKKNDEGKKDEGKKEEDKKKEEEKYIQKLIKAYKAYNPYMTQYYYVQSVEENPNACVIC